jgi:hypothetical protein
MVTQVAQGQVEHTVVKVDMGQLAFLKKLAQISSLGLISLKARQNMKVHQEDLELKLKAAQAVVLFGSPPQEQSL